MSEIQTSLNELEQVTIGDLLDGRYFYIPAYQRGYRWGKTQIEDLLRDLLTFAYDNKADDDFYCMQPVIAKKCNEEFISKFFEDDSEQKQQAENKGMWEIVDGQQRLTSIYIIFRYIMNFRNLSFDDIKKKWRIELYNLCYETRQDSSSFLKTLSDDSIATNIDFDYIKNVYGYIDNWICDENGKGAKIADRYRKENDPESICNSLLNVLRTKKGVDSKSVQVIWYELSEDKDAIDEFQKINTGKLKLTDAELIKGILLQKKNFEDSSQFIKQAQLAIEWEQIENTLHASDFWYFLQNNSSALLVRNRIDLIFRVVYKKHVLKDVPCDQWDKEIESLDAKINDPKENTVFRYFYDRLEGLAAENLRREVHAIWNEVQDVFRMLDDWYHSPLKYNRIGFLSQCNFDLTKVVLIYENESVKSDESFIQKLDDEIKKELKDTTTIKIVQEEKQTEFYRIQDTYDRKKDLITKLLLMLNVELLNHSYNELEKNAEKEAENGKIVDLDIDAEKYKFAFDLYNSQLWNVEHVDSQSTNELKKDIDKIDWVSKTIADLKELNTLNDSDECRLNNASLDEKIKLLKTEYAKESNEAEQKALIGNLVLLDEHTNKAYGNRIFVRKRAVIIDRMKSGAFVPLATQFVFMKMFDKKGTSRSCWTEDDMNLYNDFIYKTLKNYLPGVTEDEQ